MDWNQWLKMAFEADDIDQIRDALAHGADANLRVDDQTVLFWATFRGSVELVRLLIEAGATVSSSSPRVTAGE